MTHQITKVIPLAATQPGALDGFAAVCSCGDRYTNSLSAREAHRLGVVHVEYMNRKVQAIIEPEPGMTDWEIK